MAGAAPEAEVKAEVEAVPEPEAEATAEPEAEPVKGEVEAPADQTLGETDAEVTTTEDRADHYRAIAEHREQAVEHPGRAQIEAARAAQARIDQERAEAKLGEPPVTMGGAERTPEAEHSSEAEAGA